MHRNDGKLGDYCVDYFPRLVEEAVLLHIPGHTFEKEFRDSRDAIYELEDADTRESQFLQLHQTWFRRLGLDDPVLRALGEQPLLLGNTTRCRVVFVTFAKEEGADLRNGSTNIILLKLRPKVFLNPPRLLAFLRHEFMHLFDMLDPVYGYDPELPVGHLDRPYDRLVRDRYRVLWDTWIDGRLLRRDWAEEGVRKIRLKEFEKAFPMLEEPERCFEHWFQGNSHTHHDLVAFALDPNENLTVGETPQTGRCPLCQFPSHDLRDGRELPEETQKEILVDFPDWQREEGVCRQCADLYGSRQLSWAAERRLPRAVDFS